MKIDYIDIEDSFPAEMNYFVDKKYFVVDMGYFVDMKYFVDMSYYAVVVNFDNYFSELVEVETAELVAFEIGWFEMYFAEV